MTGKPLTLRVNSALLGALKAEAEKLGLHLTEYVRMVLADHCKGRQRERQNGK